MSSQLTRPSNETDRATEAAASGRRPGTLGLEIQSTGAFALAILIGGGALAVPMPLLASIALLGVSVAIISRALVVLAADPTSPRALRPRNLAGWDGTIAVVLAVLSLVLVVAFATGGALVAAVGAIGMAALRLRTRYVVG